MHKQPMKKRAMVLSIVVGSPAKEEEGLGKVKGDWILSHKALTAPGV